MSLSMKLTIVMMCPSGNACSQQPKGLGLILV